MRSDLIPRPSGRASLGCRALLNSSVRPTGSRPTYPPFWCAMKRYTWLVALAIPPTVAGKVGAPRWPIALSSVASFIRAATLGDDPDEHLLGEGFAKFRTPALLALLAGGLIPGGLLLLATRAIMSNQWASHYGLTPSVRAQQVAPADASYDASCFPLI